eukprot:10103275-Alexandrium_andersonii.AAC.1
MPAGVHRTIMKKHGERWRALGPEAKQKYNRMASLERSASHEALESQLDAECQELSLLASRAEAASATAGRPPLLLSAARLGEGELAAFGA